MRISIRRFGENLIDMIFPPRCAVCDKIILHARDGVCEGCISRMKFVEEPYCYKCGKPLNEKQDEYCKDCISKTRYYEEGRSVLIYDEYMSKSIYRFKYHHRREYANYYGKIIFERLSGKLDSWNIDGFVPVPVHKSKLKSRGYNQAEEIARVLSKYTKIPTFGDYVIRKKSTTVQKNLNAKDRENNLKKAFIVNKNSVKLRTVAVVDDIYTTGSTVDAIAKCLKDAGVEKVYFITLCIGRGI